MTRTPAAWSPHLLSAALVAGALVSGPALGAEPAPDGLTLAEAVRIALQRHPALRAAGHQVEAAQAGVQEARAGFLPRIDFAEGVTRGENPVYAFGTLLNQGRFTQADFAVDRLNHPDPITNWRTTLSVTQPVFTGGRTVLSFQQAQLSVAGAEAGRLRTEQEVIFGVVRGHAAVLLSQEALKTVEAAVRTAEANLDRARSRYGAGLVVESDVLAARVRLARLREEAIAARYQVTLARAALNDAIGLALNEATPLAGDLRQPAPAPPDVSPLEAQALERRPDYRQLRLEEERLEREIRLARSGFLPTLELVGTYELNHHGFASDGEDAWTVGALLQWNVFRGGGDRARIVQAQAQHDRLRATRERTASAIRLEVRDAFLALRTAEERIGVAEAAVTQAAEALRIVQNRYEAGLTTVVELLDAEVAATAARLTLTRALYEATVGSSRLDLSLGSLDRAAFEGEP